MRKIYKAPCMRIELHMRNLGLLGQIQKALIGMKINATSSERKSALYINGMHEVKKHLAKIGFANQKHLKRIKAMHPEVSITPP